MKFVLTVAFIIVACIGNKVLAHDDAAEALIHTASEKCKGVEGVSDEEVDKFKAGEYDDGGADKNVMCYTKCMLEEFDGLDGDVLKEDVFLSHVGPHFGEPKAKEIYDLCKGEVGDGECETPFKIVMCLRKTDDIFKF